ncbi:MAG: hypothetical protein HQK65_20360, partial [Desulfamplus sp.]|nr:hypothetical protein [Desulfamplus sp.]
MPDNNLPNSSQLPVSDSGELLSTLLTKLMESTSSASDFEAGLADIKKIASNHLGAQGASQIEIQKAIDDFMDNLSVNLNKGVSIEDSLKNAIPELDLIVIKEKIEAQSYEDNVASALASGEDVDKVISKHLPEGVSPDSNEASVMMSDFQESLSSGKSTADALGGAQKALADNIAAESATQGEISDSGKLVRSLASGEN